MRTCPLAAVRTSTYFLHVVWKPSGPENRLRPHNHRPSDRPSDPKLRRAQREKEPDEEGRPTARQAGPGCAGAGRGARRPGAGAASRSVEGEAKLLKLLAGDRGAGVTSLLPDVTCRRCRCARSRCTSGRPVEPCGVHETFTKYNDWRIGCGTVATQLRHGCDTVATQL